MFAAKGQAVNSRRNMSNGAKLLGLLLLASATLLGCACQRARHGVILRGQWSLELNRVPWISARTVCDCDAGQSDGWFISDPVGADGQDKCSSGSRLRSPAENGQPVPSPTEPRPAPLPSAGPTPEELSQSPPGRCGIVPRLLGRCGRAAHAVHSPVSALAATPMPPGTQEHSRFHPVPTQPVFAPRGRPTLVAPSNWRGGPASRSADMSGSQPSAPPIQIQIAPPQAETDDSITHPEGNQPEQSQQKEDRVTSAPEPLRLSISAATPNWIFTNPAQTEKERLAETLLAEPPVYRAAKPGPNRNR